jgi:DNA-binding response OmpR family regulator
VLAAKLKTILIIEDDPTISYCTQYYFEMQGYDALTAQNGFEALELLKNIEMPNIILLDMKMPIMNGAKFSSEFLAKFDHRAPVIVMAASSNVEQQTRDISANGWIRKPFDFERLLEMVKKHETASSNL